MQYPLTLSVHPLGTPGHKSWQVHNRNAFEAEFYDLEDGQATNLMLLANEPDCTYPLDLDGCEDPEDTRSIDLSACEDWQLKDLWLDISDGGTVKEVGQ